MKKITVIMATYNGIKYIKKQLDSLRTQSLEPDEVLIRDDQSTDGTPLYIKKYIEKYNLETWNLKLNKVNKGWRRNFIDLMNEATGEIIFYCDQDDIWEKKKIQIMANAFQNKSVKCLMGKLECIDDDDNIIKKKNMYCFARHYSKNSGKLKKIQFSNDFMKYFAPGCITAFRRDIAGIINQISDEPFFPDRQIARLANIDNGLYELDSVVIKHRMHNLNNGGSINEINGHGSLKKRIDEVKEDTRWLNCVLQKIILGEEKKIILKNNCKTLKKRINLMEKRNVFDFIYLIRRKEVDKKTLIADIMYSFKLNKIAGNVYSFIMKYK